MPLCLKPSAMALTRLSAAQARVLCLHYYSNALGFNFEDEEEVYREEKIKEWEPVDPADIEVFLQLCVGRGGASEFIQIAVFKPIRLFFTAYTVYTVYTDYADYNACHLYYLCTHYSIFTACVTRS